MKDTENRTRTVTVKKGDDGEGESYTVVVREWSSFCMPVGLPRAASWANKGLNSLASTALHNTATTNITQPAIARQRRTTPATRQQRSGSSAASSATVMPVREKRIPATAKTPSIASSSRPATPASGPTSQRPTTPPSIVKIAKHKERVASPPPRAAAPAGADSDTGSGLRDLSRSSSPPEPAPSLPPGLPPAPPGLAAPPGLPPPTHAPLSAESSPQPTSQGPYQMSTMAQALVEDIKARRESTLLSDGPSPFPDFDRMLQSLTEESGFSFSLDPKLAGDDQDSTLDLPDFDVTASKPFAGNFFDAFPSVRQPPPPGLGYLPQLDANGATRSPAPSVSSSYTGSFDPFAGERSDDSSRQYSPLDDDRKVSRFGFARGRQGSASASATASPMHVPSSLSLGEGLTQSAYFGASEVPSSAGHGSPAQWNFAARHHPHEYLHQSNSALSSPLAQQAQVHSPYMPQQQPVRFPHYDVSEAQLRDLINASRERTLRSNSVGKVCLWKAM